MQHIFEEVTSKPHCEVKLDSWDGEAGQLLSYYDGWLAELDTESSRTGHRLKKNWPIEKILKKCESLDDLENQVGKTWKKKSDIHGALIEFIHNQRKFNDTQR